MIPKKITILLFAFFVASNIFGQSFEIDSLKRELTRAKHDTLIAEIYIEIGDNYESINPDSAILNYNNAIVLVNNALAGVKPSDKVLHKTLINLKAKSLRYIGIINHYQGNFDSAIEFYKKALDGYASVDYKKGISDCYNNSGSAFLQKANYREALENYSNALKISQELNDDQGVSMCYLNMAIVYRSQGEYDKSIEYNQKALQIFLKLNDKKGEALYYNSIGIIYKVQGNYDKAIDCYIKSLKIKEVIGDRHGMAQTYSNIGNIYKIQSINDKALEYYIKAQSIYEELENKDGISTCYLNIGNVYSALGKDDNALDYYTKSITISEEIGNKEQAIYCFINVGSIYQEKGNYDKALSCYEQALSITNEIGSNSYIADVYVALSDFYLEISKEKLTSYGSRASNLRKATDYGNKALLFAQNVNNLSQEISAARTLMDSYKLLGDNSKALEFAGVLMDVKDSLYAIQKTQVLADMEGRYQNEKKQKEIEILAKDSVIAQEKAQKQKIIIFSISTGLGFLVFLVTFILRRLQITRRQKRIIEEQNNEILEKNEELNQLNEEISAQRDNLELMNIEITLQRDQIARQHDDITASINYASRIQQAMLPPQEIVAKHYPEFFVMYRPCQIVSGDFYWFKQFKNIMYIAAADCTGHGIPGAFMSMLGLSLLNETIGPRDANPPHESLNEIRKRLKKTLHQTGIRGEQQDGMDMALCMIDLETNTVQFTGAYNPFYLVRNGELQVLKGDRMPIGVHPRDNESFTTKEIQLQANDCFYIFSDGYVSQTNGEKLTKFKSSRLQETLLQINAKPMGEQKQILENTFDNWKGHHEQVDDVLVVGVRVH